MGGKYQHGKYPSTSYQKFSKQTDTILKADYRSRFAGLAPLMKERSIFTASSMDGCIVEEEVIPRNEVVYAIAHRADNCMIIPLLLCFLGTTPAPEQCKYLCFAYGGKIKSCGAYYYDYRWVDFGGGVP